MNTNEITIMEIKPDQLSKYQTIEMHKHVTQIREYHSLNDYHVHLVQHHIIDLADEEDIDDWKEIIDFKHSKIFVATHHNKWVGGCVIITNSPKVHMFNQRMDYSVLWDIRVKDDYKHLHIGTKLFKKAIAFSKEKGCNKMIIETQNNNVNAILFYEKMGAYLHQINKNHYKDTPEEDQLIFHYDI